MREAPTDPGARARLVARRANPVSRRTSRNRNSAQSRKGVPAVGTRRRATQPASRTRRQQCPIKMARRRPRQLSLPSPPTWGGRRAGAGRKPRALRPEKRHVTRPVHNARHPVHVTIRAVQHLPSLRSLATFDALAGALTRTSNRRFSRATQFSVQTDHLHLIVEAASREALIRGLQGLAGRTAHAVNRARRRTGKVWCSRYHARVLTTPSEVRNALVYVLLNFRKHLRAMPGIDPRSSGPWFGGWSTPPPAPAALPPVVPAQTWLGAIGWRRAGGSIDPAEMPAR